MRRLVTKRSLVFDGRATSLSMEDKFWESLKDIAERLGRSVPALIAEINRIRPEGSNLSSAVRIYVLHEVQKGNRRKVG